MKEYKNITITTTKKPEEGYGQWNVTISGDDWTNILKSAQQLVIEELEVPGFRKGKVPANVAEKHLTQTAILNKASNKATQIAYKYGLEQKDLDVKLTNQPEVVIREINNEECKIDFNFDLPFSISVKEYKNHNIKKSEVKATKEEVNEQIKNLKDRFAVYAPKEKGTLVNGEIAIFDFEGKVDGKEFPGNQAKDFELEIGSKRFIPGFEEQMVGMKLNEEKVIKLNFPEEYHVPNLKGKPAEFAIVLKGIKIKTVNDDLAELVKDVNIPDVKTEKDLLKHIENQIVFQKTKHSKDQFVQDLFIEILKTTELVIPRTAVLNEAEKLFNDFKQQLKQQNLDLAKYEQMSGLNEAAIRSEVFKDASWKLKTFVILEEVAKLEDIKVEQNEIDEYLTNLGKQFNMPLEEVKKQVKDLNFVTQNIKVNKTLDFLWDHNGTSAVSEKEVKPKSATSKTKEPAKEKTTKPTTKPKTK